MQEYQIEIQTKHIFVQRLIRTIFRADSMVSKATQTIHTIVDDPIHQRLVGMGQSKTYSSHHFGGCYYFEVLAAQ